MKTKQTDSTSTPNTAAQAKKNKYRSAFNGRDKIRIDPKHATAGLSTGHSPPYFAFLHQVRKLKGKCRCL